MWKTHISSCKVVHHACLQHFYIQWHWIQCYATIFDTMLWHLIILFDDIWCHAAALWWHFTSQHPALSIRLEKQISFIFWWKVKKYNLIQKYYQTQICLIHGYCISLLPALSFGGYHIGEVMALPCLWHFAWNNAWWLGHIWRYI